VIQLVEYYFRARKQSVTVPRGLDASRRSIEETRGKHVLEPGDDVRNCGLSDSELRGGFGHAARLHDREEDLQVPESQAPNNMLQRSDFRHSNSLSG
jgi:hypothetical protein